MYQCAVRDHRSVLNQSAKFQNFLLGYVMCLGYVQPTRQQLLLSRAGRFGPQIVSRYLQAECRYKIYILIFVDTIK